MAKGYHVLAGFLRDLRNARGDAADGSATAGELLDALDDELELLYERSDGDLPERQEGNADACGDDTEDSVDSPEEDLPEARNVRSVGAPAEGASNRVRTASVKGGVRERELTTTPSKLQMELPGTNRRTRGTRPA